MKESHLRAVGGGPAEPPFDSAADQLLHLVHWTSAASRHLRKRLAEIALDLELSDSELLVVWLCSGAGRVQIEIAAAIGTSPAQMSGMVERLRARGLVAMHRLAADRRRQICRTTSQGQELLHQLAEPLTQLAAEIGSALSPDDQRAVQLLCEQLAEAIASAGRRDKKVVPPAQRCERGSKEAA